MWVDIKHYVLRSWQQEDIVPRNMTSRTDVLVLKFRVILPREGEGSNDNELIIEKRFMMKRERLLHEDLARQHIVGLLSSVRIFDSTYSSIVTEIYSTIVDKSNEPANARPKILPIVLEIDIHDNDDWDSEDDDDDSIWDTDDDIDDWDLADDDDDDSEWNLDDDDSEWDLDDDDDDPMMRAMPASEVSIRGLEKVELKDIDLADECMICLEELSTGLPSGIIRMPCSHFYHYDCIVEWLQNSHLCPLCRFEMPLNSEL